MNDRFRFRAWNDKVEFIDFGSDYCNGCEWWDFPDVLERKEWVVEQCTGLKDKNGRLIYEGDIVKRIPKHDEEDPTVSLQVEWNNKGGRYITTDKKHSTWTFSMFDYFYEVVGNIHENPELLEDK